MTRDIQGLRDGLLDPATEDEIYAALWATAPFPRLPEDAPDQLNDFIVDVTDPKRLYTIHRAARRHQFQILVDRYISQIRYGCQVKSCTTTTCFSCRKRLAAGAPVRRYNATSARTLAIYMASQDNPDRGLCHHPSADRPAPQVSASTKPRRNYSSTDNLGNGSATAGLWHEKSNSDRATSRSYKSLQKASDMSKPTKGSPNDTQTKDDMGNEDEMSAVSILEQPTTTDHRSFVQNVFGTFAFKMVEWLTPRNLEVMSRSGEIGEENRNESLENSIKPSKSAAEHNAENRVERDSTVSSATQKSTPSNHQYKSPHKSEPKSKQVTSKAKPNETVPHPESKPFPNSVTKCTPNLNGRKRSESTDAQSPKSILNLSSRTAEAPTDMMTLPQYRPIRKLSTSDRTLITNPALASPTSMKPTPMRHVREMKSEPVKTEHFSKTEHQFRPSRKPSTRKAIKKENIPELPSLKEVLPPQSLSLLPIDLLNFLCDTLQEDGTSEKHDLQPAEVSKDLKRWLNENSPYIAGRTSTPKHNLTYPKSAKEKWKSFIEQCLFDILSKPSSLVQSFSHCDQRLYDTQTVWYLMLRLTRVAPSLVFDSLWNAAGDLFNPPETLDALQDWTSESPEKKSLSNGEAARLINVCLHALVATAPLVSDARQLANMSRIRSFGLAMVGRETSSLEPVNLCLEYEDAFTNDLALRLARRLFASIPIRRRFTELMELQNDARADGKREPDVLEGVLATLKFLDLGTTPALEFTNQERDLHEKRVPTLLLDWARTVMLQDWNGSAEVAADGSFGGALAMMAAIYKHRKSLLLGDIHFRTEYFAERLDPVGMPLEWLAFETNKRAVHLLDYPYLFNPSTLVTYFRAINYSRMNAAYESAKATTGLMHSTISEGNLMTDQNSRHRLFDRLRIATSKFLVLEIGRNTVLKDTFNAIWRREERELMRPLKIRLGEEGGEEGMDSGGVQQEFFRLAVAEAFDPDNGTFTIDSRTKMTWFQPGSPEPLWKFELIGSIISLAVYNGLTLPVTFPNALYRKLLDQEVTELHHIADGWPDLCNGLTTLLEWDEKDGLVEDIFARTYEFSIDQFGETVSREMSTSTSFTPLWPQFSDLHSSAAVNPEDAPMVTNENRNNYVSDYIHWLTSVSIAPQFEAFKKGFFTCLNPRSLSLFDAPTLQSVIEGIQEIDVSEMRRATRYIGWDTSSRTVRDFWSIVKRFDLPMKRKLLEFVTASDRVPVGGMRNLQFTVQRNGVDDGWLPTSYTCYGILLLPDYSSKEVLREKLKTALENSKGFGFA